MQLSRLALEAIPSAAHAEYAASPLDPSRVGGRDDGGRRGSVTLREKGHQERMFGGVGQRRVGGAMTAREVREEEEAEEEERRREVRAVRRFSQVCGSGVQGVGYRV